MVIAKQRAPVLERRCKGAIDWRCIGQHAGTTWEQLGGEPAWGQLRPGYADPAVNATGLLVLGAAAADFLGTSDYSNRDMDSDPFLAWLTRLEQGAGGHGTAGSTPLSQQLQFGPGRFDVVGTTEAEAGPLLARSAQRAQAFILQRPATPAVAGVVLAHLRQTAAADRLREVVEESAGAALAEAGWRVDGQQPAAGVETEPPLTDEANLPRAGVLDALRTRWREVAR
jgi:hypothetical protein